MWIVSGRGKARIGDRETEIATGDFLALPIGPECAHQIVNDSANDPVFLCLSTLRDPDFIHYPESGKVGLFSITAPGAVHPTTPPPPRTTRENSCDATPA
jgi:uncharacterized cupin superfamily protein